MEKLSNMHGVVDLYPNIDLIIANREVSSNAKLLVSRAMEEWHCQFIDGTK